jgi:hypothetical protein
MFVDMLEQAEALASAPEFYNSVTNTCATSIAWHMSKVTGRRIRFDHRILFPGYADELALERGTIDFDGDIQAARETFQINSRSQFGADGKVWSRQIRTR